MDLALKGQIVHLKSKVVSLGLNGRGLAAITLTRKVDKGHRRNSQNAG